jgi:hypothetical protein
MSTLYQRLDKSAIRLLNLTDHDGETAVLELRTYARAIAPGYDAVSYAWGEDLSTISVLCNGHELCIRKELFHALPYIHNWRQSPQVSLWIDAICLNQQDDKEKAIHVPLMGPIYENAARCLVWLGQGSDESDTAMYSVRVFEQTTMSRMEIDPTRTDSLNASKEALRRHGLPPMDHPRWQAVRDLQLRSWFHRLWTLQEIVLSKEAVLMCGTRNLPWHALTNLIQTAISKGMSPLVVPHYLTSPILRRFDISALQIESLRQGSIGNRSPDATGLSDLMYAADGRKYTEPVDRCWALLGLVSSRFRQAIDDANLVDYSPNAKANYHETYLGTMKIHVSQFPEGAMQLLSMGVSHMNNPKLPSWCPDWHLEQFCVPVLQMGKCTAGFPQAGPESAVQLKPSMTIDVKSSLNVCGIPLDTVRVVSSTTGRIWGSYKDENGISQKPYLEQCWQWLVESAYIIKSATAVAAGEDSTGNYCTEAMMVAKQQSDQQLWVNLNTLRNQFCALIFKREVLSTSDAGGLFSRCRNRKIFAMAGGRYGIGPSDMRKGDLVCVFLGGGPLFVLRKAANQNQNTHESNAHSQLCPEDEFELVGDAYVPELMRGEVFQLKSLEFIRYFKLV